MNRWMPSLALRGSRSTLTDYRRLFARHPAMLAGVLAMACCVLAIASLFSGLVVEAEQAAAGDVGVGAADERPDYAAIADWHLFAPSSADGDGLQPSSEAPVATTLSLTLIGTWMLSSQPREHYAVIQHADGGQHRYRVGDDIVDGARLQAVEARRVIIRRGEVNEYLAFQPNPLSLSVSD